LRDRKGIRSVKIFVPAIHKGSFEDLLGPGLPKVISGKWDG